MIILSTDELLLYLYEVSNLENSVSVAPRVEYKLCRLVKRICALKGTELDCNQTYSFLAKSHTLKNPIEFYIYPSPTSPILFVSTGS